MGLDKRQIAQFLRKSGLLQLADHVLFLGNLIRNWPANRRFRAEHPDYPVPPAHLAYDAYGNIDWKNIYLMGLETAELISGFIRESLPGPDIRICEWGCGPARVLRHLKKIDGFRKVDLVGTDYNGESIDWCRNSIPNVRFEKNSLEPPLPFAADSFDCVYSISVFTHLSEKLHFAWIEELFRVLKSGGILIFTTHGDMSSATLLPGDREEYDSGKLVIKDRIEEGKKHFLAYHPPAFVREKLLMGRPVLRHATGENLLRSFFQDWWVVRKVS